MGMLATPHVEQILDRMVREKEITAGFFTGTAERLEDADQRRWFRRMAQDEKDQRKILLKHRRELCGTRTPSPDVTISRIHTMLLDVQERPTIDYLDALRLAVITAEHTRDLCSRASDVTPDRSCRIFLKILSQESEVHRKELLTELRREERDRLDDSEELAA